MKLLLRILLIAALLSLSAAGLAARPAQAATLTVTTCADSGAGSLRQAVNSANNGDTILFAIDCPASSPLLLTTQITVSTGMTISGAGREVVLDGNHVTRIFDIATSGDVRLEYLTLRNGSANRGSAIQNISNTTTIDHVTFINNSASSNGGAVFISFSNGFVVQNSRFINNTAAIHGGAIYAGSNITITDTLFSGNHAYRGGAFTSYVNGVIATFERVTMSGNATGSSDVHGEGGAIYQGFGSLNILNSTLSGNGSPETTAYGSGMYLYWMNSVVIKNSTIVNNQLISPYQSAALHINTSTLYLYNTILANNTTADCYTDDNLTVSANLNNLIRVSNGCPAGALSGDPLLGALADNGGATRTHALLSGSPAIDAGDNAQCLSTDQRGLARPVDGNGDGSVLCDIGAFEVQESIPPTLVSITRANPNPTNAASLNFTVAFSESVTGVGSADFSLNADGTLSGAQVSAVSGSGAVYTVTVTTGSGSGTLRLDLPASADIRDLAGNPLGGLPYTGGESYTLDRSAPTVVSITRADPNPTSAASVRFTVTFSEAVSGVDSADFSLTSGGALSGAQVGAVSGSGAVYTVTVTTGTGGGTLRLDVTASAEMRDAAGNLLSGLPYTGGDSYLLQYALFLPMTVKAAP